MVGGMPHHMREGCGIADREIVFRHERDRIVAGGYFAPDFTMAEIHRDLGGAQTALGTEEIVPTRIAGPDLRIAGAQSLHEGETVPEAPELFLHMPASRAIGVIETKYVNRDVPGGSHHGTHRCMQPWRIHRNALLEALTILPEGLTARAIIVQP